MQKATDFFLIFIFFKFIRFLRVKKKNKTGVGILIFEHLENTHSYLMGYSRQNSKMTPGFLPPGGHFLHKTLHLPKEGYPGWSLFR